MGCLLIIVQREDCICLDALKWKETIIEIVATCTHNLHWMCADASMKGGRGKEGKGDGWNKKRHLNFCIVKDSKTAL